MTGRVSEQQQRRENGSMPIWAHRIPEDLRQQVTLAAGARGMTPGEYVRMVLRDAVRRELEDQRG